jgi:hypothetical protein
MFGGQGGSASKAALSTQICGGSVSCTPSGPPNLKGWNAGLSLATARYLMGSTIEAAHIFIVGGNSGGGPTNSVETTVW